MSLHTRVGWCLLAALMCGCGDKDLQTVMNDVKESATAGAEKVSSASEKVQEQAQKTANAVQESVSEAAEKVQSGDVAEAAKGLGDSVSKAAESAANAAAASVDPRVRWDLQLDAPVKAPGCFMSFVPGQDGRANTLQFRSYAEAAPASGTAVFLQVRTTAESLEALVGKTMPAELFVHGDGPIWYSAEPIQIQIRSFEVSLLSGEITGGQLQNTDADRAIEPRGTFAALLK
ncbi:MAG: hypothetical protein QF805_03835 [Pirellulaceae bacterium]|nr:hypothetical protein [Pirellulaceae bacterium]